MASNGKAADGADGPGPQDMLAAAFACASGSSNLSVSNWNLSYTTRPAKIVLARDIAHVQVSWLEAWNAAQSRWYWLPEVPPAPPTTSPTALHPPPPTRRRWCVTQGPTPRR